MKHFHKVKMAPPNFPPGCVACAVKNKEESRVYFPPKSTALSVHVPPTRILGSTCRTCFFLTIIFVSSRTDNRSQQGSYLNGGAVPLCKNIRAQKRNYCKVSSLTSGSTPVLSMIPKRALNPHFLFLFRVFYLLLECPQRKNQSVFLVGRSFLYYFVFS